MMSERYVFQQLDLLQQIGGHLLGVLEENGVLLF